MGLPTTACPGVLETASCSTLTPYFSVFVFQQLGDVVSLLAQVGGSFSLITTIAWLAALIFLEVTRPNMNT